MTVVGISFGTLIEIAFWGWVAGIVTGLGGLTAFFHFTKKKG